MRVRLTVAYDGRGFHGFAAQASDIPTVGGALTEALEKVVGAPVALTVAGRTDTGVHAWGNVVSFDAPDDVDLARVQRSVNTQLGARVVVRDAAVVGADFDARRSARSRVYRYTVLNRVPPDPFRAATSWHVTDPLDLSVLRLACDPIMGDHDFSAFCRVPRLRGPNAAGRVESYSMVRRVMEARWDYVDDGVLRFTVEASSFCQQMVRALVGTMVAMGTGQRKAGEMSSILRSRSRQVAGRVAPPHGLCLWEVRY